MAQPSDRNALPVAFVGRTTFDALYRLDRLPTEDTKVFAESFHAAPGGPACNAAITHSLLGGRATLISAVGQGPWVAAVRESLAQHGVALVDMAAEAAYETPLTCVLVGTANASRTIINPPSNPSPTFKSLVEWDPQWGDLPRVLLTDGFYLEEALPLLRSCRQSGTTICLDGGSWKPGTDELVPLLSAAICSERFALPGMQPDSDKTLDWFAGHGVAHVAVTRGARPIVSLDRGRSFEIDVERVDAVDTLGAGDVLHGAFCHHLAQGFDFESSLRKASLIATRSCQGLGVHSWLENSTKPA